MKKLIALLLFVSIIMCGCGDSEKKYDTDKTTQPILKI